MADKSKPYSAAYVSWATVEGVLKQLSQALPHQIDRSVFPGLSWTVQNQLLAAMKFLGLTDDTGKPTAMLSTLVEGDEKARREYFAEILKDRYAELFKLDLLKASPLQIQQAMTQFYGVSGDTLEKAMRFFVSATEYSGIAISPLLAGKKADGTTTRKKRGPGRKRAPLASEESDDEIETPAAKSGTAKTVQLQSGGSLTLTATLDLFSLNPGDRKFVFDLIDKLEEYERLSAKTESHETAKSGDAW